MTTQPPIQDLFGEDDDFSPECKDLLASLPKQSSMVTPDQYQYQGMWLLPKVIQSVLYFQQHFKAQDTDIILVSFPKTGTTWLKAIAFCILNRSYYSTSPSNQQHPLLSQNPQSVVQSFEYQLYVDNPTPDLTSFPSPRLFGTHLPFGSFPKSVKDSGAKVVYILRDAKDTFVSYWKFMNKLRDLSVSLEQELDNFCNGLNSYGSYWDHILSYWNENSRSPNKVFFCKYEDLKQQPNVVVSELATFMGCPFSPEEVTGGVVDDIIQLCSFDKLSNLKVNKEGLLLKRLKNQFLFRRGETGDWKNYLTDEMADRLDKINQHKFAATGFKF